jgi:hypothetical protein
MILRFPQPIQSMLVLQHHSIPALWLRDVPSTCKNVITFFPAFLQQDPLSHHIAVNFSTHSNLLVSFPNLKA